MNSQIKHIHLMGIGGTGMSSLARLFIEKGYKVTGSDNKLYPPVKDQLAVLNIMVMTGYKRENLKNKPDLVVIGNVIRKDNKEAEEVLKQGIKYCSMPVALNRFFLKDRMPIVVAGTHGKTTTSTLLAWVLDFAGEKPGYFIGGIPSNFGTNSHLGEGQAFVIEGDEYDTAFFDKGPKFLHYVPKLALINNIEFDHADIYRDLSHINDSFNKFISIIPEDGALVINADDKNLLEIAGASKAPIITYAIENKKADYIARNISTNKEHMCFDVKKGNRAFTIKTTLFGNHNISNILGGIAVLLEYGISFEDIQKAILEFKGIKRRQEIIGEVKGVTVIDDFAHHPTAVRETILSTRIRFPNRKLWAVFEPRSNTSRRNLFLNEYIESLSNADRVIIANVYSPHLVPEGEQLAVDIIAKTIMKKGIDAHHISNSDYIVEYILRNVHSEDVILMMSNGDFDNLGEKLIKGLKNKKLTPLK